MAWAALALVAAAAPAATIAPQAQNADKIVATGGQMLDLAAQAAAGGHKDLACQILKTLLQDRSMQVRNEARFRLALFAIEQKEWASAGVYLRAIIDEEPTAQRARLELARVQAEAGDIAGSRRTLQAAQAGGLPPDVARVVDRFSAALRDRRPFGASLRLAFAPDTNINRATQSQSVNTTLGNFVLDDDARSKSGVGAAIEGEVFFRQSLTPRMAFVATASVAGNLYRQSRFNDVLAAVSVGPEFSAGKGTGRLLLGAGRRWFGGDRYSATLSASANWTRPLDEKTQVRGELYIARSNLTRTDVQDATVGAAAASVEHAVGVHSGVGATIGAIRQVAREPGYSTATGYLSLLAWREVGRATVSFSSTFQHLKGDRRLAIYSHRRADDFLRMSLAATLRRLQIQGWAPEVKLVWERNSSSIEVYQYRRIRGEFGLVRSF